MKAIIILTILSIKGITSQSVNEGDYLDSRFAVDPRDYQLNEMSQNINKISGAVMGIAELVVDIKADLRLLRKEFIFGKPNKKFESRIEPELAEATPLFLEDEKIRNNVALADRVEKLLAIENNLQVDLTKEEIKKTIQVNFVRVLSAMLVTGPPKTQQRKDDILKLMKSVLNGELDFGPVVEKLPFILRDSETNQFISLIKTLREEEVLKRFREGDEDGDGDGEEKVEAVAQVSQPQNQAVVQANVAQPVETVNTAAVTQTQGQSATATGTAATATQTSAAPMAAKMMMKAGGLTQVFDAVGMLDVAQLATFLSRLPEVFEGVEGLVDGVEDYLSFGDIAAQTRRGIKKA